MHEIDTTGVPPLYVFLARWSLIVALLGILAAMLWMGKITSDVALPLMIALVAAAGISPVGPTSMPVTVSVRPPEAPAAWISAEAVPPKNETPPGH